MCGVTKVVTLLKELCHGVFRFFGQNCLKLELSTFVICEMLIEHKEEDVQRIFEEEINHNQSFSEFSKTEAINLKKSASFFQDAIHFHPGHLQPKTPVFTLIVLVE